MKNISISLLVKVLALIISMITPELKDFLKKTIDELAEKAKATSNPFDDVLVQFLRLLVS